MLITAARRLLIFFAMNTAFFFHILLGRVEGIGSRGEDGSSVSEETGETDTRVEKQKGTES